jgi:phosphodiesterase/alkaline phosphatase D-like protein
MAYGADLTFSTPQVQEGTNVTLAWPANPETNIAGYIVYYGVASGAYTNSIDVGNVTNYTVSGLVNGTTYYFNVSAYNDWALESELSGEISLTAGPVAGRPVIGTVTANANTSTSVLVSGQVNPNGSATTVWFQYGLDSTYGQTTGPTALGSGTSSVTVDFALGNLLPGRTYQYRVVAVNSVGVTLGSGLAFATPPDLPSATAQDASDVTSGTAALNALVNGGGADGGYYFEYGLDTTYGVITDSGAIPAGNTDVAVSMPIAQLLAGTVYHYRVLATNSAGKICGADVTFTTLALAPDVTTDPPDGIGLAEATLNGDTDPNGANTSVWFEYGVNTNYGSSTATAEVGASDGDLTYSAQLSTLSSSTTYHYRMVASNSLGVTYGADVSFTTLSPDADVTTLPATGITTSKAALQGSANPNNTPGGAWFEYGLTTNYVFSTPVQDIGSGGNFVPVTSLISNLQAGQTWHYRLAATNSGGSNFGSDMTFTTPTTDLSAVTLSTRLVKATSVSLYASITPMAYPATVYFEYGTTTNFTSTSSSIQLNAGTSTQTVNKRVYNLATATTYFYRVVATNKYDKVYGQILSFTTR